MVPTTMLVSGNDLADRLQRGAIRHVVAQSSEAAKFDGLDGDYGRIAIGERVGGWHNVADAINAPPRVQIDPDGRLGDTWSANAASTFGPSSSPSSSMYRAP